MGFPPSTSERREVKNSPNKVGGGKYTFFVWGKCIRAYSYCKLRILITPPGQGRSGLGAAGC